MQFNKGTLKNIDSYCKVKGLFYIKLPSKHYSYFIVILSNSSPQFIEFMTVVETII